MRQHRLLTWSFVLVLFLTPMLSACAPDRDALSQRSVALSADASAAIAAVSLPVAAKSVESAPLPPTIIGMTPARGQEHSLLEPVVVTFDQPMDPDSTTAAFTIMPEVPGSVEVVGTELIFTPEDEFERAARYKVTLEGSASGTAGLPLGKPVTFEFATVGFIDVTATQPADGTEDVPVDTRIVIGFNRPMVPLTGDPAPADLPLPLIITPDVSGTGRWLNTGIYEFTPENGFAASTDYTVTLPAGIQDTAGNLLAEDYSFRFRTTDPVVLSWQPEADRNVKVEIPFTVTFSMPMDRATTEAAFTFRDGNQQDVAGTFTWNEQNTELSFKPSRLLAFGTRYEASVANTARPANGQGTLRDSVTRVFTTVALPGVLNTDPRPGDNSVDPLAGVAVHFAGPMDPRSFVTGTITILPTPTQVYTSYNEWDSTLYISFDKLPSTSYTLTLSGGLADTYGNTLGEDFTLHFRTRDYDPLLQLNSPGLVGTFNAYTPTQVVVTYRNIPEITFRMYRVPVPEFITLTGRDYWMAWNSYQPQQENLLREWTLPVDAERNQTALLKTDLVTESGEQLEPGLYFLELAAPTTRPRENSSFRQLAARTNLNVTLKTAQTEALAWVTDLKSGQPVEGIQVRFTDGAELDMQAITGADGIARVTYDAPHRSWDPFVALATGEDGQFGVASNAWEDGISPWNFNLPGGGQTEPYVGYVYTDRPIYRPGQTMYWKAIIRRDNDALYSLPEPGQVVTASIYDGQGNQVYSDTLALDPMGTANGQLVLDQDASLGYYSIGLTLPVKDLPDRTEVYFGTGFQVAEYRKPEYELSAQTDKLEYVQGEQVNVTVQADYFFGGPVRNARVRWVLLSSEYGFDYQGEGNFSFADWDWYDYENRSVFGGAISEGEGVTDAQGRFTFSVPADITRFPQSQRFTFDVTITDANNQAVSTQATTVVHKGDFYIGLAPQSYVATTGERNLVDVITVDPESRPVSDVAIEAVVTRVEWYSVREQAENGRYYWTTRSEETPVFTDTVTTDAEGRTVLTWIPDEGGQYKVKATGRDRNGHRIRSAAYVWVGDREYVNWRQENNDRIQLVADREQYRSGDTAEVLLASPYQGTVKALLTIERNGILSHEVIEIDSNSELLRIPIKPEYAPDVFVSVVMVKGMDETSPAPSFKMGLAQLKVSVADKELQITLTPRAEDMARDTESSTEPLHVGPRETVTWDIQTLDAEGRPVPADVSLALVDKAVLSLAADNSGTLMDRFYSQRSLGVRTATTLVVNVDRIVAQLSSGGKGGGGGGGPAGEGLTVRSEFPDIAYWNANVTTGEDGKAEVEITLPDNLTTWTMDARAVTADTLVGQRKMDIIATKDLLVRPVLPRFFIEQDEAEIAAVIHNNTADAMEVTIDLDTTGLELGRRSTNTVTVAAASTYKAAWPVTVMREIDQVGVTMAVRGVIPGGRTTALSDAVEMTLPVYRYTTPEVVGTSGQVDLDESRLELVRLPEGIDPVHGELDVKLEPSLAAGMAGGLTYLEHYPYECVEQTMSRFLPNVVTYAALRSLGLSQPELETRLPQQVGVGLQRIYANQHLDGGWGWWQRDASNPTISAYVVFGLAKAQAAGFSVDPGVIERGVRFLERSLRAPQDLSQWQLNQQAFIVYALAEAGRPEPNRAGGLFEARERMSLYAKGYLALALSLVDDNAAAERINALLAEITSQAITSATSAHWEEGWIDYWNMNTDIRTTSIILDVLARLAPDNTLAPNAVRWLMSARKAAHWETTQENAWAIMALTDWMLATGELEGNYSWTVLLNGDPIGQGTVTPDSVDAVTALRTDIGKLLVDQTNSLVFQRSATTGQTGKGQLYYTAHLKTYQAVENLEPVSRGVSVSREYRLADCVQPAVAQKVNGNGRQNDGQECPTITEARVGDVISVKLNIVVPNTLHYLVVEDPLPAGAEAIDTSLRTTSVTAQGPQMERIEEQPSDESRWWDWWWMPTHTDLRDEKVALFATNLAPGSYQFTYQIRASLPGRFLTLPPTGYEMYFPEVWGRGAGSVFTVTE